MKTLVDEVIIVMGADTKYEIESETIVPGDYFTGKHQQINRWIYCFLAAEAVPEKEGSSP